MATLSSYSGQRKSVLAKMIVQYFEQSFLMKTNSLWSHLYWLTVLAEQKSFTRAADKLEISKAALSTKIKELEQSVGVALVLRTTRNVRLTSAGEKLVSELQQPFEQIEQSFLSTKDAGESLRGLIRITAPVAFARQQLIPLMSQFLSLYPEVRIQLEVSDNIVSLIKEGYDLAIRHSNNLPESSVALPLCKTKTVLVASPDYLAVHGTPKHPSELTQHACLYYPRGIDLPRWRFKDNQHPNKPLSININGPFATNNSESIRDAALTGLGIAMLPDFSTLAALRSKQLVELFTDWPIVDGFSDQIWIIRPYATQVPRVVTVFTQWLRTHFVMQ